MKVAKDLFGNPVISYEGITAVQRHPHPRRPDPPYRRSYRFVDLFCGGGAFHLAMGQQNRGHRCVLACDVATFAKLVYNLNFPDTPYITDVRRIDESTLPRHDIICGGFPCQGFSLAGSRQGFQHPQGSLFFEILRLADIWKTRALVLENVPAITSIDEGASYFTILKTLQDFGYEVFHRVLSGHIHGDIPQIRQRLFIVAFRRELDSSGFRFPAATPLTGDARRLMEPHAQVPYKFYCLPHHTHWYQRVLSQMHTQDLWYHRKPLSKEFELTWVKKNKYMCPTLTKTCFNGKLFNINNRVITLTDDKQIRTLTWDEARRYMGFPDDYKVPRDCGRVETNIGNIYGNSIVVPVAYRLLKNVVYTLDCNNFTQEE